MTPEKFNRLCAEFMGHDYAGDNNGIAMIVERSMPYGEPQFIEFDPYHNANDRNKVIENMEISVERDHVDEEWISYTRRGDGKIEFMQTRINREESEIACIEQVLEGNSDE